MAIKIIISKQMVACDKHETALLCSWSVKYHTCAFLSLGKALDLRSHAFPSQSTRVIFSLQKHTRAVFLLYQITNTTDNWCYIDLIKRQSTRHQEPSGQLDMFAKVNLTSGQLDVLDPKSIWHQVNVMSLTQSQSDIRQSQSDIRLMWCPWPKVNLTSG
jgi:hypothetical protein